MGEGWGLLKNHFQIYRERMKFRRGTIVLLCCSQVGVKDIKLSDPLSAVMCLFEHALGGFSAALTALGTRVLGVFPE